MRAAHRDGPGWRIRYLLLSLGDARGVLHGYCRGRWEAGDACCDQSSGCRVESRAVDNCEAEV